MKKPGWIKLKEAAALIGCSIWTARRLAVAGKIESYSFSDHGWRVVERRSVEKYVQQRHRKVVETKRRKR